MQPGKDLLPSKDVRIGPQHEENVPVAIKSVTEDHSSGASLDYITSRSENILAALERPFSPNSPQETCLEAE